MKFSNLKEKDDARPEDSMPPLPQATDEALPDESWPIWEYANCVPSINDDGKTTPATQKQENSGVGGPTFNKLLAAKRRGPLTWRSLRRAKRDTVMQRHQSDPQRSDRTAIQRSGWQDSEKLHDIISTGQDTSGPDERAQAWRENHKSGDWSDSPSHHLSQNHAGRTQYTRTTNRP